MKSRLLNYQVELELDRRREMGGTPKVEVMTNPAVVSSAGEVKTGAA